MKEEWMVTTSDNPYSPFREWEEWYAFDVDQGYHTCALLDRVTIEGENIDTGGIERGQADVVRYNVSGVHILTTDRVFEDARTEPASLLFKPHISEPDEVVVDS